MGLTLGRSVERSILNPDFKLIRPNPRGSSARCKPLRRYLRQNIDWQIDSRERPPRPLSSLFRMKYKSDTFIPTNETLQDKIKSFLLPSSLDITSSTLSALSTAGVVLCVIMSKIIIPEESHFHGNFFLSKSSFNYLIERPAIDKERDATVDETFVPRGRRRRRGQEVRRIVPRRRNRICIDFSLIIPFYREPLVRGATRRDTLPTLENFRSMRYATIQIEMNVRTRINLAFNWRGNAISPRLSRY